MKDVPSGTDGPLLDCDAVQRSAVSGMDLAQGSVRVVVELKPEIFYQVLSEQTGLEIGDEAGLMPCILELAHAKREYEKVRSALEQVEATGYGIVMPSIGELQLEQPEIVRALRRPAGSLCAVHPHDEGHHPHRDQPHCGHREAERRSGAQPAGRFCG